MTDIRLYTAEQSQRLDRLAIERMPIEGYALMTLAAKSAVEVLRCRWPEARHVTLFCGPGNNGGDGLVMARLLKGAGLQVAVVMPLGAGRAGSDADKALLDWNAFGGECQPLSNIDLNKTDLIVDALFGSGLARNIEGDIAAIVAAIDAATCPVMAVDIPSGLSCDTGCVLGIAAKADVTVTFITNKLGLHTGFGPELCGEVVLQDLDVPAILRNQLPHVAELHGPVQRRCWPARSRAAHKGTHGSLLVVGGGAGMPGATLLAAKAAMRVGAGKVRIACDPQNAPMLPLSLCEVMASGVGAADGLKPLLAGHHVVAVGPGLGRGEWAKQLFSVVIDHPGVTVVDADALTLLAEAPFHRDNWILTPHPGEAATLLSTIVHEVQADRLGAATEIVNRYGGVCVLKGAGTIIACSEQQAKVIAAGNPGMATAGSGDVLTGVIGGLLAQFGELWPLSDLATEAALIHAMAGDLAAGEGERGLMASDLIEHLRSLVNQ